MGTTWLERYQEQELEGGRKLTFKEQIAQDNQDIFMNQDEFSEIHVVNGKEMTVQIDSNELIEREKHYRNNSNLFAEGIYRKNLLIYVREDEFGTLPAVGRLLVFDGKNYIIMDAVNEDGIYSISLEANKA